MYIRPLLDVNESQRIKQESSGVPKVEFGGLLKFTASEKKTLPVQKLLHVDKDVF